MGIRFVMAAALAVLPAVSLTAPTAPAAAQTPAQPAVTADFLYGRWTDTNNCSDSVEFLRDGSFATTDGARGRWTLANGRITFVGNSTLSARIHATSPDAIVLTHDDGSVGHSTRCSATPAQVRPMPALPASIDEALRLSGTLTASQLLGRWTDDGDCNNSMVFRSDGTFTLPSGGGGRWTLANERLTFIAQRTLGARARAIGNDRIILIHDDGSLGQSMRC